MAAAVRSLLFGVGVLAIAGCRGWRGYADTYFAHRAPPERADKEATFRFGRPGAAWEPVKRVKDVQVAWVNREIAGFIEIHAQCDEQGDSSLHQYADHLRIDWTDWRVIEQTEDSLVDRAALRTVVDAALDGVVRRSEFVVVKKSGCLFDLRYSAKPATFDQGRSDFQRVVTGFEFPVL